MKISHTLILPFFTSGQRQHFKHLIPDGRSFLQNWVDDAKTESMGSKIVRLVAMMSTAAAALYVGIAILGILGGAYGIAFIAAVSLASFVV